MSGFTADTSKEMLGGAVVGLHNVPDKRNVRTTENAVIDGSVHRTSARPERVAKLDSDGQTHYYVEGAEITKEEFFKK